MDSQQTGLLERLRAQRESMQMGSMAIATASPPVETTETPSRSAETDEPRMGGPSPLAERAAAAAAAVAERAAAAVEEHSGRLNRLEASTTDVQRRLESVESDLRAGLADLRRELPNVITAEVARTIGTTNEAVTELGGRLGKFETEFTRERDRWSTVVQTFDQRMDQRLRSFRQDVTVMLTGMAVLILAMLMMLLLRR